MPHVFQTLTTLALHEQQQQQWALNHLSASSAAVEVVQVVAQKMGEVAGEGRSLTFLAVQMEPGGVERFAAVGAEGLQQAGPRLSHLAHLAQMAAGTVACTYTSRRNTRKEQESVKDTKYS